MAIGYPGPVMHNRPMSEPHNLAKGWVGFRGDKAFGCPVKLGSNAATQKLGVYKKGKMLFLGLGTDLGSTLIMNGMVEPMELGQVAVSEGDLRRLRRPARIEEARQKEMAQARRQGR